MDEVDSFYASGRFSEDSSNYSSISSSDDSVSEKEFADGCGFGSEHEVLLTDTGDDATGRIESYFWLVTIVSARAQLTTRLLSVPAQTNIAKFYKLIAAAFGLRGKFSLADRHDPAGHPDRNWH